MVIAHCPRAQRLLAEIRASHQALITHAGADDAGRCALDGLYRALAAGLAGVSEDQILVTPAPDEWSMAEVLEHIAEHDRSYTEFQRLGLDHYIEHGLEHALQLWRLRAVLAPAGAAAPGHDGSAPGAS